MVWLLRERVEIYVTSLEDDLVNDIWLFCKKPVFFF